MVKNVAKKMSVLGILFLVAGVGGFYYFRHTSTTVQTGDARILDFDRERDTDFILDIFKTDYYWLVKGNHYSPEYFLKHGISEGRGRVETIKVLYVGNEPVGFAAYFMENFYTGFIHFIATRPQFRSKGYGRKLVAYAIDELRKMGAKKITLVARVNNEAALKAYKSFGFVEKDVEEGVVSLEKNF